MAGLRVEAITSWVFIEAARGGCRISRRGMARRSAGLWELPPVKLVVSPMITPVQSLFPGKLFGAMLGGSWEQPGGAIHGEGIFFVIWAALAVTGWNFIRIVRFTVVRYWFFERGMNENSDTQQ